MVVIFVSKILILGSGPNVIEILEQDLSGYDKIVVINNAWKVVEGGQITYFLMIFQIKTNPRSKIITKKVDEKVCRYSKSVWRFRICGRNDGIHRTLLGTWLLFTRSIDILGCDMVYPKTGSTHFYGTGTADPLREDISLRSLEAKSARVYSIALRRELSNSQFIKG